MRRLVVLCLLLAAAIGLSADRRALLMSVPKQSTAAPFTYYSAVFDGSNDYLTRGADLTGIADGKEFTLSFWVKCSDNFTQIRFIWADGGFFYLRRNSSDILEVAAFTSAATQILALSSGATQLDADGNWHHILVSAKMDSANASYLYMDGVDRTTRTTHTDGTIDFTRGNYSVGADPTGGSKLNGLMSEVYFTTEFIDISDSGNRAKFRDGSSKPVSLGSDGSTPTGTAALLYLKGEVPNWEVNAGTGGGMTENGTLVDGGSDKP